MKNTTGEYHTRSEVGHIATSAKRNFMCNLLSLTCVKLEKMEGETKAEGVGAQKRAQAIAAARMVFSLCA